MALQHHIAAVSAAANLTGFASNVTGASFTLTANDSGDALAHKVTVRNDSATDHSGKTITLVGTGPNGEPQTETLTAPGTSATVTSTKHFFTLTSAAPSATIGADTFDIGWATESVTAWLRMLPDLPVTSIGCEVVSGSPTYSIQLSFGGGPITHATLSGETTSQYGDMQAPAKALRMIFTAAGGVTLNTIQCGG